MAQRGRSDVIAAALRRIFPRLPERDARDIVDQALASKGLKTASPEAAAWLSAIAYVRHSHTEYDQMLEEGYDPESARHFTLEPLNEVIAHWGCRKRVE